jgi:spermidine/putrescine-binding protein
MRRVLIAAALSAALLATADAKEQRGTIISIDDTAKTFVCQWGTKDWTYKTTKKTGIRISNKDGSWSDLKTGARVNVGYHMAGEDRVADWVVILR